MPERPYGSAPEAIGPFDPDWSEYMHYLYLPVLMPGHGIRLPERLKFLWPVVVDACAREEWRFGYVYVTARRGFATPDNPLNRPGWHADGFGTQDVNYIWSDCFPTRFAEGDFVGIDDDHVRSVEQFETQIKQGATRAPFIRVYSGQAKTVYRLDASVIHATPLIHGGGGERSFFKISFSNDRYNLRGNSHNHLFDYDWKMWARDEVRNDPAYAGGDAGPQEVAGA